MNGCTERKETLAEDQELIEDRRGSHMLSLDKRYLKPIFTWPESSLDQLTKQGRRSPGKSHSEAAIRVKQSPRASDEPDM